MGINSAEAVIHGLLKNEKQVSEVCLETITADDTAMWMMDRIDHRGEVDLATLLKNTWITKDGYRYMWITSQLNYTIKFQAKYVSPTLLLYLTRIDTELSPGSRTSRKWSTPRISNRSLAISPSSSKRTWTSKYLRNTSTNHFSTAARTRSGNRRSTSGMVRHRASPL